MTGRAGWIYRLHGLLAAAGTLIALGALAVAVRAVKPSLPSIDGLLSACRTWLLPHVSPIHLTTLGLAALGLSVIVRGARSAARARRAQSRLLAGLPRIGSPTGAVPANLVEHDAPQAFCAGLLRPQVYVSTGAVERLDAEELHAVLAHEAHHAARRDPLRIFVAQVLSDALFFLPVMHRLGERFAALAELAADQAAVRASGGTQPLASALLAFGDLGAARVIGVSAERVDHLSGERIRWELPVSLLAGATVTVAGLGALILVAASATEMATVSAPLLLMQSCGPLMIVGAGGMFVSRFRGPWDCLHRRENPGFPGLF